MFSICDHSSKIIQSSQIAVIVVMGSLLSVDYLWLSCLYKWKPAALKSYRDTTHSHSCEAGHGGHENASIAASVQTSLQHKHTHGPGKSTQDLGEGKWPNGQNVEL